MNDASTTVKIVILYISVFNILYLHICMIFYNKEVIFIIYNY